MTSVAAHFLSELNCSQGLGLTAAVAPGAVLASRAGAPFDTSRDAVDSAVPVDAAYPAAFPAVAVVIAGPAPGPVLVAVALLTQDVALFVAPTAALDALCSVAFSVFGFLPVLGPYFSYSLSLPADAAVVRPCAFLWIAVGAAPVAPFPPPCFPVRHSESPHLE